MPYERDKEDLLGRQVKNLSNAIKAAFSHSVNTGPWSVQAGAPPGCLETVMTPRLGSQDLCHMAAMHWETGAVGCRHSVGKTSLF